MTTLLFQQTQWWSLLMVTYQSSNNCQAWNHISIIINSVPTYMGWIKGIQIKFLRELILQNWGPKLSRLANSGKKSKYFPNITSIFKKNWQLSFASQNFIYSIHKIQKIKGSTTYSISNWCLHPKYKYTRKTHLPLLDYPQRSHPHNR